MSAGSRYGQAGKLIKEAQEYDFSSNDELGAFCKYLSCVRHIAEFLSEDAAYHKDMLLLNRGGAKSVLVMAKKCLERAEDIFIDALENETFSPAAAAVDSEPPPLPARYNSTESNGTEEAPTVQRLHSLSPLEEARLKNQKLMAVYQEHLKKRANSLLPQDCNRMNLAMWKKIEENNKIARIKEKALQQKLQERTSRINKVPKVKTQLMVEHSVKEICELIMTFESGKSNFTTLKLNLQQHPGDHTHLYNLVNDVLNTAEHPLSKLLAECQYNVCESIKPLALVTAKGGNFPTLSFLPKSRHLDDPLPSVTSSDEQASSHSYASTSTINERSYSLPEGNGAVAPTRRPHILSTPAPITESIRHSVLSQFDEEEDFVTSDVFMSSPSDKPQGSPPSATEKCNNRRSNNEANDKDSPSLNNEHRSLNDEEAAYFVLEKPTKLTTIKREISVDKISTPAYEEIDEATLKKRPSSPLPYEIPSLSRTESCDAYYSNVGSPESSGYTLLNQWTRNKPEDDYTRLDPNTLIDSHVSSSCQLYPQLNCAAHFGKKEVLEPLSEKVCLSIKEVVREIHLYLDKMEQVFVSMYHGMSVESNKETCRDLVEKIFFPPIWPNLIQLYRCSNYRQEVTLAVNMRHHVNSLPGDLSVREQFQLLGSATLPYSAAIEELKSIPEATSPSPKLEILVTMSRRICQAIEEYHAEKGQLHADSSVGVDDMLPIFSYIILRSGLPQLVSECSIMDEFIQEGYLMGEEGFCLTSFQTALRYLTTMSS